MNRAALLRTNSFEDIIHKGTLTIAKTENKKRRKKKRSRRKKRVEHLSTFKMQDSVSGGRVRQCEVNARASFLPKKKNTRKACFCRVIYVATGTWESFQRFFFSPRCKKLSLDWVLFCFFIIYLPGCRYHCFGFYYFF